MPHKNALAQLKNYGPIAIKLDAWANRIEDAYADELKRQAELENFSKWCENAEVRNIITRLSRDRYAYNRELAAVSGFYLWERYLQIPYSDGGSDEYDQIVSAYLESLNWTIPILLQLIEDPNSGPAELAIRIAKNMDKASGDIRKQYRDALLRAGISRFQDVRLEVVRTHLKNASAV